MKSSSDIRRKSVTAKLTTRSSVLSWACLLFAVVFLGTSAAQSANKPIIILVGPPSSGKSTQAEMIKKQYNFAIITREQLMQDDPSLLAKQRQPGINAIEPRMDPVPPPSVT